MNAPDHPISREEYADVLRDIQARALLHLNPGEHPPILYFFGRRRGLLELAGSVQMIFRKSGDKDKAAGLINATLTQRAADLVVLVHEAWAVNLQHDTPAAAREAMHTVSPAEHPDRREILLVGLFSRDGEYLVQHPISGTSPSRWMELAPLPPDDPNMWFEGRFSMHGQGQL